MVDYLIKAYSGRPLALVLLLALLAAAPLLHAEGPVDNGYQGADYWRDVTRGKAGYSATDGTEAGVLINRSGEAWRQTRNNQVKPYGAWFLGATLVVLTLAFWLIGRSKLKAGRSGRTLLRWDWVDRLLHWLVAGSFVVLALTGLSILYGRHFLDAALGGAFGGYMQLAKISHNYLGPLFILCLLLMVLKWVGRNLFSGVDLRWFLKLGGLLGGHPRTGFANGGEKLWFWLVCFGGIAVGASGLVLDFPGYGQLRDTLQDANLIHAAVSILLIGGALGHAYMGTVGTEGALEGMISGRVDENWAKQHHDLWYDEVAAKGRKPD